MKKTPKRPNTNRFDPAPQATINRSTFDLSHPWKGTFDAGYLIPFYVQEILPGDSFKCRMHAFVRLATPLHPTLDNLTLESFFFFVPNRLTWENWQRFMGEQDNPDDSTDYVIPTTVNISGTVNSTYDYMGLPIGVAMQPNALPIRAFRLIYNQWFRDENLQDSVAVPLDDGPDPNYGGLLRRGKRKDYISSALPWPQKGPAIDIPLGTSAPVSGIGGVGNATATPLSVNDAVLGPTSYNPHYTGANTVLRGGAGGAANVPDVYADLSDATAATINELRQAFQIQRLQERDARGGTRYTEILKSHFQVTSPDARLQRAEYLGGGRTPIQMMTVPQTSSTDETSPQGNLSAFATAMAQNHGFTKSFVEHGYVIGIINVRADINYQQRMDRMWSRSTKYDFYWPVLQALGEQAILNKEVYADGTAADNDVWGYQERWSEYRSTLGKVTGLFRSDAAGTLDPWHYALDFATRPTLGNLFILDDPPIDRTIAVPDEPQFLCDAWMDIRAARPMPVYSVPGYIDHF